MSRVTLMDGGFYRWSYTLSREQAKAHYWNMLLISGSISGAVGLIMLFVLHGYEGGWIAALGVFGFVFVLPALIGWLTLSNDTRTYEMNEECIRHKNATRGGDAFIFFKKIQWMQVRGEEFTIKAGITTYTVYVPIEDAAFVKQYIRERTANTEARR